MRAVLKNRGLVILDWYLSEGMETHRAGKKVLKPNTGKHWDSRVSVCPDFKWSSF